MDKKRFFWELMVVGHLEILPSIWPLCLSKYWRKMNLTVYFVVSFLLLKKIIIQEVEAILGHLQRSSVLWMLQMN